MLKVPRLRAGIRRGLLKVEQLYALARNIYYGRRGRINARDEQMNSCSCLTLLLACVVYWQAKEISRVLKMGIPEGKISTSVSLSMSAPSNGKTSFFTASMCSTRTTFAKTDP
jgi:TnpA family transposase